MEFPRLDAEDIDVRVQSTGFKGKDKTPYCQCLLYKDARCDQRILDTVVGAMNWQDSYRAIDNYQVNKETHAQEKVTQLFCNVSIWDKEKNQWVSKENVGIESASQAEKGRASDAFKRACFNWGIGRELYTSPSIFIDLKDGEFSTDKYGKPKPYGKFHVTQISYDDKGNIISLEIVNDRDSVVFGYTKRKKLGSAKVVPVPTTVNKGQVPQDKPQSSSVCSACGKEVPAKVATYSKTKYGSVLCYGCQQATSK